MSVGTTPSGLSARYARIGLRVVALDQHELVLDADLGQGGMRRHRGAPGTPVEEERLHRATLSRP